MFPRKSLPAVMTIILALAAVAFAQQPQVPAPDRSMPSDPGPQGRGRHHDKMVPHAKFDALRQLNLTEAQRQQQFAIMQRHLESTKAQREELFKLREKRMQGTFSAEDEVRARTLRREMHDSMQGIDAEIEATLTADQRTKLEQLKTERKTRQQEMPERRQKRQENRPQP